MNCKCKVPAAIRQSQKDNENHGRFFYTCAKSKCKFFKWKEDEGKPSASSDPTVTILQPVGRKRKAEEIEPEVKDNNTNRKYSMNLSDLGNSYFVFTDGSCIGNNNVKNQLFPAGWGLVVVRFKEDLLPQINRRLLPSSSVSKSSTAVIDYRLAMDLLIDYFNPTYCDIITELYGPVILHSSAFAAFSDTSSKTKKHKILATSEELQEYSLGATVTSNNTGELCAMGEAFMWLKESYGMLAQVYKPRLCFVMYDSEYAAKSVSGEFNGPKNRLLINTIRGHYSEINSMMMRDHVDPNPNPSNTSAIGVHFYHVKAHAGYYFNESADRLANLGAAGQVCLEGRYSRLIEKTS
eukprot:gene11192-12193_t